MEETEIIQDNEDRVCHECENTTFTYGYEGLIRCVVCYARWEPLRALEKLFRNKVI